MFSVMISKMLYTFYLLIPVLTVFNFALCNMNVLFVISDDLRYFSDHDDFVRTPHLDALSMKGFLFKNSYAQQALCGPSRNSFLTSRRPDTTKLYDFYSYWREVAGNFTTLPQYLRENGYETVSIGKVFHPGESSNFSDDEQYSWSRSPWHPPTDVYKDSPVCYWNGGYYSNAVCPVIVEEQPGGSLPDIESTKEAVRYLTQKRNTTQPFFLAVGYHKPHLPLKFPEKYKDNYPLANITLPAVRRKPLDLPSVAWNPFNDFRERDDIRHLNLSFPYGYLSDEWTKLVRQSYYSSVTFIDDLFGELLASLQANNLTDNTVIIFFGDHGWSLGEHGEWGKFSNYEVSVRVPLIMFIPNVTKGTSSESLVELVDIFPTLVEILGFPTIPSCPKNSSLIQLCTEGKSLLPLIMGSKHNKEQAFSQYPRPGIQPTKHPNSDRPRLNEIRVMGYSVRTDTYRFTMWVSWDPLTFKPDFTTMYGTELYNHGLDPEENINLSSEADMEAIEREMIRLLKKQFMK